LHFCYPFILAELEAVGPRVEKRRRRKSARSLDKDFGYGHTEIEMQLSGNSAVLETPPVVKPQPARFASLVDLRRGDAAILERIDLPSDDARRLMELGFLPGTRVTAGLTAPGGDPCVFQVDGSEIALRRETARRLKVRVDGSRKKA
jgi:ferrous iron transport protein A